VPKIAVLSFWHVHAKDYARETEAHPETDLVAVWDEDPERGRAEAASRGVRFVERMDELLAMPEVDGVVVTTATADHAEVIPAAARAGKHIFTEKVIAPTLQATDQIVSAVDASGVAFVVSLPRLAAGYTRAIDQVLTDGTLGRLTYARVRVAHEGALRTEKDPDGWLPGRFFDPVAAGGGALIDLGAHPLYLLRHFLGMPEGVSAGYGFVTGRAVEDHAVVTLSYADGALGVAEVGLVGRSPYSIEIHGTEGSLLYGVPDARLRVRRDGEDDWTVQTDLPADGPMPFARWVENITSGTRSPDNVAIATDLSALAEAANRSAAEGRVVRISELARGDQSRSG